MCRDYSRNLFISDEMVSSKMMCENEMLMLMAIQNQCFGKFSGHINLFFFFLLLFLVFLLVERTWANESDEIRSTTNSQYEWFESIEYSIPVLIAVQHNESEHTLRKYTNKF